MTALFTAHTEINDAEKLQEYIIAAGPIMKAYGAEVVVRGRHLDSLLGEEKNAHVIGIFRFPDAEAVKNFLDCDEYKALVSIRNQAGVMSFNLYEE